MFVEKEELNEKQIANFLKCIPKFEFVKEQDIKFTRLKLDGYVIVSLNDRKNFNKPILITITDSLITDNNLINKSTEWKKYLYQIFGEEYKNWYIEKMKIEFENIFS